MKQTGLFLICYCLYLITGPCPAISEVSAAGSSEVEAVHGSTSTFEPLAQLRFNGTFDNTGAGPVEVAARGATLIGDGLEGQAVRFEPEGAVNFLSLENLNLDSSGNFSVQFWIRTTADDHRRFVVLSQKQFIDNSLASQKKPGWVFYVSGGTWAWNIGSGTRRITYERDNGEHMPINDGRWHQLTMTYDGTRSQIRLFFDGENKAIYHVTDERSFDFTSRRQIVAGWDSEPLSRSTKVLPAIESGAQLLQKLVDAFNSLGLKEVQSQEFVDLIVDPKGLFESKAGQVAELLGADRASFLASVEAANFEPISEIEERLLENPYTVHQAREFMEAAPLLRIYSLAEGQVVINQAAAEELGQQERLDRPHFDMDELTIWHRTLSVEEVRDSYSKYFQPTAPELTGSLGSLTAAVWNIYHGGKHFTIARDGWDSRSTIAEILRRSKADVVMMQETYSSGDFIAAELGYYFATTVDWDYLNQGSNISVLSRYPILELHVPEDATFMNVAVKVALSRDQEIYVMSNWYGMRQFPAVFDFHKTRFKGADQIPVLFGGDFNAVPHLDGGQSLASETLLNAGFTDAFRDLHPDVKAYPGFTHRGVREERRIDQLYYKGSGLRNTSTTVISTWPTGFPSDHYLIQSTFELRVPTSPEEDNTPN